VQAWAAGVWLAFEALPLFPLLSQRWEAGHDWFSQTRPRPVKTRVTYFTWPVWGATQSRLCTVRSLLSPAPSWPEKRCRWMNCGARGVEAVFRSERYRVKTQGAYFILRPRLPRARRMAYGR